MTDSEQEQDKTLLDTPYWRILIDKFTDPQAEDSAERRCIQELCPDCRHGEMPQFSSTRFKQGFTGWWYHRNDRHNFCEANLLYEMRRKR